MRRVPAGDQGAGGDPDSSGPRRRRGAGAAAGASGGGGGEPARGLRPGKGPVRPGPVSDRVCVAAKLWFGASVCGAWWQGGGLGGGVVGKRSGSL